MCGRKIAMAVKRLHVSALQEARPTDRQTDEKYYRKLEVFNYFYLRNIVSSHILNVLQMKRYIDYISKDPGNHLLTTDTTFFC